MQKLYAARGALIRLLPPSQTYVLLLTILFLFFFTGFSVAQSVTTDKEDYVPGETAVISGSGWINDQTVVVDIIEYPVYDAGHHYTVTVTNGNWELLFPIELRHFGVTFTVYATGEQSGAIASASFTDGINQQPNNQTVCAYQNAVFTVGLNGSEKEHASYTWYKVGDPVAIGTVDDVNTTATNGLYQLSRDNNGGFLTITGTPLSYNGNQYYVVVKQPKTAISAVTSNTVTLTVDSAPAVFNVGYNLAALCNGNLVLTLSGSEPGVSYVMYENNPNQAFATVTGTGNPLSFPPTPTTATPKTYYVQAVDNTKTCTTALMNGSAKTTQASPPLVYAMTGGGSICQNTPASYPIGVGGSQSGVTYQLYRNGNPVGAPVAGTGSAIGFGNYSAEGEYYALATNNGNGCISQMSPSVYIAVDLIAPTFVNPPGNVTVECDAIPPVPTLTATDNLDTDVTVEYNGATRTDGNCPGNYTLVRKWTATDDCGNQTIHEQTITVQDTKAPTASNPSSVSVQCIDEIPAPDVTVVTDEADNCDNAPVVAWVKDENNAGKGCPGNPFIVTRTYSVTDWCGNSMTVTQTLTAIDNTNPTASNPAPVDVQCIDEIPAPDVTVVIDEADNCDDAPVVAWVKDENNGGKGCPDDPYVVTRTYSVTDFCGNSITVTQTLTAIDNTNPTASNPAPVDVQCIDEIPAPDVTVVIDEADNCDDAPVVAWVKDENNGGKGCPDDPYVVTRTYSVTDFCGNSITVTQTLTAIDNTNPTASNPAPVDVQCIDEIPAPDVTVVIDEADNCDDAPVVAWVKDENNGGKGCPDDPYVVTRTYSVTDFCGNSITVTQTLTAIDNTNPTASNPAPVDVQCIDEIPAPDVTVVIDEADNCDDAPVVAWVKDENNGGKGCPDDPYVVTRTYSVTDFCGNSITVTQTLTAIDNTNPTASNPAPVDVQCKTDIPAPDITVVTDEADNCDDAPVVAWVKDENNGGKGCTGDPYIVTRTYSITDQCGNSISVTQTLTAIDNTPPVVKTKNITVYLDANGQASISALDVDDGTIDACTGVNLSVSPNQFSCADIGNPVTVTLTATDDCGNEASGTAEVTVVDNMNPVIVCKPGPVEFYLGDACQVTLTQDDVVESVSDNCGIASVDFVPPTFTMAGTYTVTVTAKDASGNAASCTTTVIIKKNPVDITYTGEVSKQYSDIANVSATVYKAGTTTPVAGVTVKFTLGSAMTQAVSAVTGANGVASTTMRIGVDPDTDATTALDFVDNANGGPEYTMTASVESDCYEGSTSTDFDVTQEDALITYTGQYFVTTASTKASSCNVVLSATIRDISVLGADVAPGDIRNAKVKFTIMETGDVIYSNVGLVNMNDTLVGTASTTVKLDVGPNDAESYTVKIEVGNYYTAEEEVITITVSKPGGEHITGGGYIILTPNTGGAYAGDVGSKNNFGFNVKYNKKNTNLQGHINTIIRRTVTKADGMIWDDDCNGTDDYPTGHTMVRNFQVKGNAMTSLSVQRNTTPSPSNPATATYFGKANLADVTGDCPITIVGNLSLRVDITDKGEPGNMDKIAILVLDNKDGGVIYTSNWNGTSAAQQLLDGGNIVIGGNNYTTPVTTRSSVRVVVTSADQLEVKVSNNPSTGASSFKLQLLSNDHSTPINLTVRDINGRSVEARSGLQQGTNVEIGRSFTSGMYLLEVVQGNQRKMIKLLKQ